MAKSKIVVHPNSKRPTHDVSFNDGTTEYGLTVENGPKGIKEIPDQASSLFRTGGGSEFGDHDAAHSHIPQSDYRGGRGKEDLKSGQVQFYDGKSPWTLSPDKLYPGMMWHIASGYRDQDSYMPKAHRPDVTWLSLLGSRIYIADKFTSTGITSANKVHIFLRKIGKPADLTVSLYSNSGGDPNSSLISTTVTAGIDPSKAGDITDIYSEFHKCKFSSTQTLTGSTDYHIVVNANSSDDIKNHWEIGVKRLRDKSQESSNGSSWSSAGYRMYYLITRATSRKEPIFFSHKSALYYITTLENGGTSKMYINGDRGVADASAALTLVDATKSWTKNMWRRAYVKISSGKGEAQWRKITHNTSTKLTIDDDWEIIPDTSSQYVIYNTPVMTNISLSNVTTVVSAEVANGIVYLAQGDDDLIVRFRWSGSAHEDSDDASGRNADFIFRGRDPKLGGVLWKAKSSNNSLRIAKFVAWGTDLKWKPALTVAGKGGYITWITKYAGKINVFKEGHRFVIDNGKARRAPPNMNFYAFRENGRGALGHERFLYVPVGNGELLRVFGKVVDSVGPNSGAGMPPDRSGPLMSGVSHPAGVFWAVDANRAGTSSVMFREDELQGWHEIFRAWEPGLRIRSLHINTMSTNEGPVTRLWIGVGTFMVYVDLPRIGETPTRNKLQRFLYESVMESSTIYMGAHELLKFFDSVSLISKNLGKFASVILRYQLDDEIGDDVWTMAGTFNKSPAQEIKIRQGGKRRIRIQLILRTEKSTTPPQIEAWVLEGFARLPISYQWNMRIKTSSFLRDRRGKTDTDPVKLIKWLRKKSELAEVVFMRGNDELMDSKYVIIEPTPFLRNYQRGKRLGGIIPLVVREVS